MEGQQAGEYEEYEEMEGDVEMDGEAEEEGGDPAAKEKVLDLVWFSIFTGKTKF